MEKRGPTGGCVGGQSDPFLSVRGCARLAVCDKDLGVVPTDRAAWARRLTTAARGRPWDLGLGAWVPARQALGVLSRQNVWRGRTTLASRSPWRTSWMRRVTARWSRGRRLTDKPPHQALRATVLVGVLRRVSRSARSPSLPRRPRGRTRGCRFRCQLQSCDAHSRSRFLRWSGSDGTRHMVAARKRWGRSRLAAWPTWAVKLRMGH